MGSPSFEGNTGVGAGSNITTTATTSDSIHSSNNNNNNNNNNNINRLEAAAAAMEAMGGMIDASAVAHHQYFHGGVPHTTTPVTNNDNLALSISQATHNSRIRYRNDNNEDVIADDLEPSPYNHSQLGGGSGSGDTGNDEPLYKRYRTL